MRKFSGKQGVCLIELIFMSLVPNPLVPLDFSLGIFSSRKIVIILNWWSKEGNKGFSFFLC